MCGEREIKERELEIAKQYITVYSLLISQTDRQTEKQTDWQTGRQTDRMKYIILVNTLVF